MFKKSWNSKLVRLLLLMILATMLTVTFSAVLAQTDLSTQPESQTTLILQATEEVQLTQEAEGTETAPGQENEGLPDDSVDEVLVVVRDEGQAQLNAGLLVVIIVVLIIGGVLLGMVIRYLAKSVPDTWKPTVYNAGYGLFRSRQKIIDRVREEAAKNNISWDDALIELGSSLSKEEWQLMINEARAAGIELPEIPGDSPPGGMSAQAARISGSSQAAWLNTQGVPPTIPPGTGPIEG
jgi:hypothetical protein